MKILDAFPPVLAMTGKPFSLDAWRAYADSVSPTLAEKCILDAQDYDFERDVRPVLDTALASLEKLHAAHESFLSVTENLDLRMERALGSTVDAHILLYLGLCSGAGWATELDGHAAVLLGLEKIAELDWTDKASMEGLVYHELGHLWHFDRRRAPFFEAESPALWQLYTEGCAMYAEQELLGDENAFHQYDGAWLAWCRENEKTLFGEYRRRVDAGESCQDFFGAWCAYLGHSDVGYSLGNRIVRKIARESGREAMLEAGKAEIYETLRALG